MYIPHTDSDREAMLKTIGVKSIADLFTDIPDEKRFPDIEIPPALSEMEVVDELKGIADSNETVENLISFLGAGAYNHYIPSVVDSILRRGEFYTAYTPYQPEISQGTLQAIFEYQSMIAQLTGMDVSNASHYDGATAIAEAVNMAYAQYRGKRKKFVISSAVHPHYRETIRTYIKGTDFNLVGDREGIDISDGPNALIELMDDQTALLIVAYPDFFGRIFDLKAVIEAAHENGAMAAVTVNPLALGLLSPPGVFGADIVTGEGQPLGIPLSYGGPYLGIFTTRDKFVRKMAGRLVGETVDTRGQRGYVLTLSTREQHIRRERATSNICTNQGLLALAAGVYLSLLGKHGLRQVAELNYHKAHYAAEKIYALDGFKRWSQQPFFNEFVVELPKEASEVLDILLESGILGGYDLGHVYPELQNHLLIAVTEMIGRDEIDYFVEILEEVAHG